MLQRWTLQPDDPRGLSLVPSTPAASTSEQEQTQDSKDLNFPADAQQVTQEEVPWSSSLDQQEMKSSHIKEEHWTNQKGDQLSEQEETDITRLTVVTVKIEDEEKPLLAQLLHVKTEEPNELDHHIKTEIDGEECGRRDQIPCPNSCIQTCSNIRVSDSPETEVSYGHCWLKSSHSEPLREESENSLKQTVVSELGVNCCTTSSGKKPFSCQFCGKRFLYKQSFKNHLRTHTEEKPFDCNYCGKRFSKRGILLQHMRVHTGEKPYGCSQCGRRFSDQGNFSKHMKVHTGEKPFSCDDCGKRFTRNSLLTVHRRVHTGEKLFSCDDCGKGFSERGNLKKHMKVHTGEKPFSCKECGQRFAQSTLLKTHMRVHTGEKPFSCADCGKQFSEQGNLSKHRLVHTGEKPYSCNSCGKRFNQMMHLKGHMKVHSNENLFPC
ncbi:hypothetical protein AMECASPLE_027625 [Ameca splendens]|uniref:C2H2-type domain-containing protein n=1 Tax=Ameca splendens TaxID=208324 RepID=A0ABV0XI80_9TELE